MFGILTSPITTVRRLRKREELGASAVEYGLLVAAVAAGIVAVVFSLGTLVKGAFTHTSTCIEQNSPGFTLPAGTTAEPCNN